MTERRENAITTYDVSDIISTADITALKRKMAKINAFRQMVREVFVPNQDYGLIQGKPVLFKSGAEKLILLLGLQSEFEILDKKEDWDHGFFAYTVRCKLKRGPIVVAEGLGHANTREKARANQDPYTSANAVLKMAEKRALVDASLHVGALSDVFTQDLEDLTDLATTKKSAGKTQNGKTDTRTISMPQLKRLYALAGGDSQLVHAVIGKWGYKKAEDVLRVDYDKICDYLQKVVEERKKTTQALPTDEGNE